MSDDDKPEPAFNPYESPRVPAEPIERPAKVNREGWKITLLVIAVLLGFISVVPWLAAIFAFLSAPIFLRFYLTESRMPPSMRGSPWVAQGAGVFGSIFLVGNILAAAAGAFLGTCTASMYAIAIPAAVMAENAGSAERFYSTMESGIFLAIAVGVVAFVLSSIWLLRRPWRDS